MPLDFDALPVLIGPKRRSALTQAGDRERLAHIKLKRRMKKPGKAHATNQERSHIERVKAAERKRVATKRAQRFEVYRAAVRAYWIGERDSHPGDFEP